MTPKMLSSPPASTDITVDKKDSVMEEFEMGNSSD